MTAIQGSYSHRWHSDQSCLRLIQFYLPPFSVIGLFSCWLSQSVKLWYFIVISVSQAIFFSVLRSDCLELDFERDLLSCIVMTWTHSYFQHPSNVVYRDEDASDKNVPRSVLPKAHFHRTCKSSGPATREWMETASIEAGWSCEYKQFEHNVSTLLQGKGLEWTLHHGRI